MTSLHPGRIIHVPRRFVAEEWGGTETVILEISRHQQHAGWQPEVYTSMALATERRETIGGIPVRRFPYCYPFFGLSAQDRAAMDKKGGNLLSISLFNAMRRAPDVRLFHAHALKRLGGEVRTAARWQRKPFVVSLHGGVFDVPTAELDAMLKPIENKTEWGKPFGALFGSRRVLEDADFVICVGQSEMEKARQELTHNRLAYLPNGVDCAKFASADGVAFRHKHGISGDALFVLNISRIDSQKNQLLLLEGFARLHTRQPHSFLALIGPETQPAYAARLRDFIQANQLAGCVKLLPGLRNDDPELVRAFHACDVFVLPSMHEPFGIVVLEAWSAGRAVIASHVGGLKALIRDGETGFFMDPNARDAAADLAGKLERLIREPGLRKTLGDAGRHEAQGRYDWSQVGQQLERLYQQAEENAARRYGSRS
ncbi:MAG TPA: glycosyltransferase family 4 protein [Candidatus Paceibacterota bacterium]|nr:glycosyltransferase family 4 protein [Verrucomicrobiota bacterium]HRY46436.1 glycosyltransferase family 4 protein [Candidatus Paceibacterota bacterium]